MKISKIAAVSLLGLSIAVLPANLPASAQNSSGSGTTETSNTGTGTTTTTEHTDNHGGYWGLLGLLGLFGLVGRGNKATTVAYRDPEEARSRTNTGI